MVSFLIICVVVGFVGDVGCVDLISGAGGVVGEESWGASTAM